MNAQRIRRLALVAAPLLLVPSVAAATQLDARAATVSQEAPPAEPDDDSPPLIGLIFDVGVPDGATLGAVVRPLPWLRTHVGGSFNLAGWGVRAGATYVPFNYWVVPTAVVEGGYFFSGNTREALRTFAGIETDYAPEDVKYGYFNAHLGLEFGGDWFTIFLRGGYSYIDASIRAPDLPEDGVRFEEDTHVAAWTPSAKLGVIVYVY